MHGYSAVRCVKTVLRGRRVRVREYIVRKGQTRIYVYEGKQLRVILLDL